MFAVIFEVHPRADRWDAYLGCAKLLRPELLRVDGFNDNVRYRSLRRPGWVLSLSTWRDEKALIRWRTLAVHHDVQERGRTDVFQDYHLRVGQVTADTRLPEGQTLREHRLDDTETGISKVASILDLRWPADLRDGAEAGYVRRRLGLAVEVGGLADWDVFTAILAPTDALMVLSWRNAAAADAGERNLTMPGEARMRRVRVVRDYGMFDRREAPQYYPSIPRPAGELAQAAG